MPSGRHPQAPALRPGTDYDNFPSTSAENVTQVTDALEQYTLWALDGLLNDPSQVDVWFSICHHILDQKNLGRFLDPTCPRPLTTDLDATKWYRISKGILALGQYVPGNLQYDVHFLRAGTLVASCTDTTGIVITYEINRIL